MSVSRFQSLCPCCAALAAKHKKNVRAHLLISGPIPWCSTLYLCPFPKHISFHRTHHPLHSQPRCPPSAIIGGYLFCATGGGGSGTPKGPSSPSAWVARVFGFVGRPICRVGGLHNIARGRVEVSAVLWRLVLCFVGGLAQCPPPCSSS